MLEAPVGILEPCGHRSKKTVGVRHRFRDLGAVLRAHVEHLDALGRDLLLVIVPVAVPLLECQRPAARDALRHDVLDLRERRIRVRRIVDLALDDRFRRDDLAVVMERAHHLPLDDVRREHVDGVAVGRTRG
jgi:hypothetical protein